MKLVLSSECPRQYHAALPLLDLSAFKASSYPCQLHSSLLSLSFFPSCPHLTFSFQINPAFPVVVTYLTLSSLKACALFLCLWHLSPNFCDLLSLVPIFAGCLCLSWPSLLYCLTYQVLDVSYIPFWPFCFPSLCSFHFLLLFNLHWYVSWNTASTPCSLFLSSTSSFFSSPCYVLAMVFHFQFHRGCKCNPFWQKSWATFLSISLV